MKKFILLYSMFCFALFAPLALAADEEFDVRNVRWGMTEQEVLEAEKGKRPALHEPLVITYEEEIFGPKDLVIYQFEEIDGKKSLCRVQFAFFVNNSKQAAGIYQELIGTLKKKYGKDVLEKKKNILAHADTARTAIILVDNFNYSGKDKVLLGYENIDHKKRRLQKEEETKAKRLKQF